MIESTENKWTVWTSPVHIYELIDYNGFGKVLSSWATIREWVDQFQFYELRWNYRGPNWSWEKESLNYSLNPIQFNFQTIWTFSEIPVRLGGPAVTSLTGWRLSNIVTDFKLIFTQRMSRTMMIMIFFWKKKKFTVGVHHQWKKFFEIDSSDDYKWTMWK